MSGQIFVFSGPSGVGKSTLISKLRESVKGLEYSVSHTSRAPRKNEINGVDYHFVDEITFKGMIGDNAFIEWAKVYDDLYGTSFSGINDQISRGSDVVLDLDGVGAKNIKEHYRDSILIFILPPSLEVLEERLRRRAADGQDEIDKRIGKARNELRYCSSYDYMIINDDLEKSVEEAKSIIISSRSRNSRMLPKVRELFGLA